MEKTPFQLFDNLIRNRQIEETNIPELVGFEHHLSDQNIIDVSFYYSRDRIVEMSGANAILSLTERLLLSSIRQLEQRLNLSLVEDVVTLNGIWLEVDKMRDRVQIYLNVYPYPLNELKLIPRNLQPMLLDLCSSETISHIGYVLIKQEICGFKVLQNIILSDRLLAQQYSMAPLAKEAMKQLSQTQLQAGYAFLGDAHYESSLEVDACPQHRFTSQERWAELFQSSLFRKNKWELSRQQILQQYSYRKFANLVQISGINHIKFSQKVESSHTNVKLYSGILTRYSTDQQWIS